MGLTYLQIYEKTQQKFPGAVAEIKNEHVDPYIVIKKDEIVDVCSFMKDDTELLFDFCSNISGVDDTKTFWVVYHLYSIKMNHLAVLKVDAGKEDPWVPSVMSLWSTADWHEREAYDLYGIKFEGHKDLRRILLPEDWTGYPLRKDYDYPEDYQGIPLR